MGVNPDILELFPEGTTVEADRGLTVGGVALSEVADRFSTPAYVVDEAGLRARIRRYRQALSAQWPNSRLVFASKSFPCVAAYRLMAQAGVGVDVAGLGELAAALRGGVEGRNLVLHGNAKTGAEIERAVAAGVGLVVVDNFDDIDRLERALEHSVATRQDVLVRVLPEVRADTYEAVATGQKGSKFGLPLDQVPRAIERIRASAKLRLAGVHTHVGSQILDVEPFAAAVRALAGLGEFETYNLGGGLGARYTYTDHPPEPEEWIAVITDTARRYLPGSARLMIEPGRSLVARSGVTLYRVVSVKRGDRVTVAVDGGMADNMEVALYGQRFEATLVDRVGGGERVDIVGRHCESGDRISSGVTLRAPRVGDVVAIPVTGAYCHTMANNYNGALKAPVVFCADGEAREVVRRETLTDFFARDTSEWIDA
ncbi:diaminopimelate decarboxylase [Streptomyces liliiviolaceus]|uniref:diaminopimelate decarboxylase n=1 Tax=Streptomyces liliiviolaceus TaxID=2823109 RepID=UPI001FFC4668|nr:diaminopimelate decarboxylase [Streptomyces liliiviolaceus]